MGMKVGIDDGIVLGQFSKIGPFEKDLVGVGCLHHEFI